MDRQLAISIALSLVLSAALVFGVREWDRRQPQFGVIDIAAIMKAQEAKFTNMVLKPGATDDDKKRAYELVRVFGNDLSAMLKTLPDECRCTVLNKAAFIAGVDGTTSDLTPKIMQKLGLQ